MPNHITNRLEIIGEQSEVNKLKDAIRGKYEDGGDMFIDFNKIVPMPKELEITSDGWIMPIDNQFAKGTSVKDHLDDMRKRNIRPEDLENFIKGVRNYVKYGHATWYSWAVENWGTKWNAYGMKDHDQGENIIVFETAWSSPIDLIDKLSTMFPEVELKLTYADEDSGSNTGRLRFKSGKTLECNQPESQSREGYDIYFELNPDRLSDYDLVDGKYTYKEEA